VKNIMKRKENGIKKIGRKENLGPRENIGKQENI
jgi:hypothetical protein